MPLDSRLAPGGTWEEPHVVLEINLVWKVGHIQCKHLNPILSLQPQRKHFLHSQQAKPKGVYWFQSNSNSFGLLSFFPIPPLGLLSIIFQHFRVQGNFQRFRFALLVPFMGNYLPGGKVQDHNETNDFEEDLCPRSWCLSYKRKERGHMRDDGIMAPERSGSLPKAALLEGCG